MGPPLMQTIHPMDSSGGLVYLRRTSREQHRSLWRKTNIVIVSVVYHFAYILQVRSTTSTVKYIIASLVGKSQFDNPFALKVRLATE